MTQTAWGTPVDGCGALVVAEGRRWLRVGGKSFSATPCALSVRP